MQKSQMSKSSTSSRGSVLERTIDELYCDGPERADAVVFGREVGATRRRHARLMAGSVSVNSTAWAQAEPSVENPMF